MARVEFRILGPVEVLRDGQVVAVPPGRQLALLTYLLLHANTVVGADRLVEELWNGRPPASAAHAVQVYVSKLRALLEPGRPRSAPAELLVTQPSGYALTVDGEVSDAARFVAMAGEGHDLLALGRQEEAGRVFAEALRLWRGPALGDLAHEPWAIAEATRLEGLRLAATEGRIEAELALGRHAAVVPEVEALVARHPFREGLWEQLMVALYRAGRQTEALRVYQRVHHLLGEELGLEPGPALREMEVRILQQDPDLLHRSEEAASTQVAPAVGLAPTTAAAPPDAGRPEELRIVSLLVAAVGSCQTAAGLVDADELALAAKGAVDRMVAMVEAFGGVILDRQPSGIAALFGAPIAYEDDPGRAVDAGLAIVADIGAYGEEVARAWGVEAWSVHAGVHTGKVAVIAGAPVGGETLATAAELRDAAPPGTVLASSTTVGHVRPLFEWDDANTPMLAAAGAVCRVRRTTGKARGLQGREAPLVGRDHELAEALRSIDALLGGTGGVLIVSGDAGHGKSRLLAELREHFGRGASAGGRNLWLEGRCLSWGGAFAYWPFREVLREWLGVSDSHPARRTRELLRARVDELYGTEPNEAVTALAGVLGLPSDRDDPDTSASVSAPPDSIRAAAFGALLSLFQRLADNGPVVVAIDDFHWADPTSIAVVGELISLTESAGLLVILAMRPERDHASWVIREEALRERAHRTREVVLGPLAGDLDARLLAALVGPDVLPSAVANEILEVAEGNPFFIEELVRSLLDSGVLVADSQGWRFKGIAAIQLPTTIEHVLSNRIDRLPADARAILDAAAVVGRQVDVAVLARTHGDPVVVDRELPRLERLRLLAQARRWPRPEFRFCHPLLAQAVYRRLLPERRKELHHRAGDALEALFPDRLDENAAVLAFHAEHAEDIDRAITYYRRAGDTARASHALDEAVRFYSAALGLLESGNASPEVATDHQAALHFGRGYAWWQLTEPGARGELHRAVERARNTNDLAVELASLEVLSVVEGLAHGNADTAFGLLDQALAVARRAGDTAGEVAVRNRITIARVNRLDLRGALVSGEEAFAAAHGTGDERLVARALDGLKLLAFVTGDFTRLRELGRELEGRLTGPGDRRYLQYMLAETASAWAASGDFDSARQRLDQAQALNEALGSRFDAPYVLTLRAWLERTAGAYGDAIRLARAAADGAAAQANTQLIAWCETNLGAILLEVGAVADAMPHLDVARDAAERGGIRVQLVRALAHGALARQQLGDPALAAQVTHDVHTAVQLLDEATVPASGVVLHVLDAYLAIAAVRSNRGEIEALAAWLSPVLAAARDAGWIEGVARTELALGTCSEQAGDVHEATRSFEGALDLSAVRLPTVEWQVRAARSRMLTRIGDTQAAEQERRAAGSIVTMIASSLRSTGLRAGFETSARSLVNAGPI
ncbi:MAG: Adenylate cyclase / Guanylate cyclase [uncultured Acidimicrobiales bacterium]|uniref:Adenylate cyclase / Guanylate cyclase n=1 Tax=uncultured Acidimicrobiales bacterium TaxID=310071 RepID=A0A6J4JIB6_9ACTN|nr:MAG: Adenylate cyclase / Guanylate cyclase [uncultured Acidimicrobiales bacterium]